MSDENIKLHVRKRYGDVARNAGAGSCCTPAANIESQIPLTVSGSSCCCGGAVPKGVGDGTIEPSDTMAEHYSPDELAALPDGANLGLGCGVPTRYAQFQPGETVLDLGSGAGVDCFIAARFVGKTGTVIGVDMTPEMVAKARANAEALKSANVSFRLGEIEALPVERETVDVVISNCVLNLVPDKPRAFAEIARVLKPGGRMVVSDMMVRGTLPDSVRRDVEAWAGCIAGAPMVDDYLAYVRNAGLENATIVRETPYEWGSGAGYQVVSCIVAALKP